MKKMILVLMSVLCLKVSLPLPVKANEAVQDVEISELNQIMTAKDKLDIKEMPDDNATTVITYESGAAVFVVGETTDGWYKVSYQDKAGYVRKEELIILELDVEGIDNEMTEITAEGKQVVEVVERYRNEAQRTKIWGTVIVLLVVGIFATGIVSTMKSEKEEDERNNIDKVAPRKYKATKSQAKTVKKPDLSGDSGVEKLDLSGDLDIEKQDSSGDSGIEKQDLSGDPDREKWDSLGYTDKEEWDSLGYTDKEEWDSLPYLDKEDWKWN